MMACIVFEFRHCLVAVTKKENEDLKRESDRLKSMVDDANERCDAYAVRDAM